MIIELTYLFIKLACNVRIITCKIWLIRFSSAWGNSEVIRFLKYMNKILVHLLLKYINFSLRKLFWEPFQPICSHQNLMFDIIMDLEFLNCPCFSSLFKKNHTVFIYFCNAPGTSKTMQGHTFSFWHIISNFHLSNEKVIECIFAYKILYIIRSFIGFVCMYLKKG